MELVEYDRLSPGTGVPRGVIRGNEVAMVTGSHQKLCFVARWVRCQEESGK